MSKCIKTSNKHALQDRLEISLLSARNLHLLGSETLIAAAVFIIYFPSLSGKFIMDDEGLLAKNKLVLAPDGPYQIWCTTTPIDYWPVTNTALWIEWRLWDQNPAGHHFTNLILHIAEVLLVWTVLRKLSIPGALLAAVIFAVHPVNVESVAWIAQRKNMMAMLFFLLSILWYLKYFRHSYSSFILHPSSFSLWYWLSLAAFLLAMLSKGSVAVFPVLLLGIIWWLRSGDCPDFSGTGTDRRLVGAPCEAWSRWSAEMGLSPYSSDPGAAKTGLSPFLRLNLAEIAPFFLIAAAGCGERMVPGSWF